MFKEFREKQVNGFPTFILEDKPPKIFSLSSAYSRLVYEVKRSTVHFIASPSWVWYVITDVFLDLETLDIR